MAISNAPPRGDGTIYGVPFQWDMLRYEYVLPDGARFDDEKFQDLVDYVVRNHKSFEQTVLAQKQRPVWAADTAMDVRRQFIIKENKKAQLKWDKEFNRRVVNLVRRAIEEGMVSLKVATMQPFKIQSYSMEDTTMVQPSYESFDIWYDRTLPDSVAYLRCREQAEAAVKKTLPPPDLLPMV